MSDRFFYITLHITYGNIGCRVSSLGIQNSIVFCLKVKCFEVKFLVNLQNLSPFLMKTPFQWNENE